MLIEKPLTNGRITLRNLSASDVSDIYVGWLTDPDVIKFLEVRFHRHTIDSTIQFVNDVNGSSDVLMLGIFVEDGRKHIGNIKLGPINKHHKRADIGLLIGDKSEWGKGYATEAIALISEYGFGYLALTKITAGCYHENQGSLKAFEKVGFSIEARLSQHWITESGPQDEFLLGLTADQYKARRLHASPSRFGNVRNLVLIGGGDLMVRAAELAIGQGYRVVVVLAPRHADEFLPLAGGKAKAVFESTSAEVCVIDDINAPRSLESVTWTGRDSLALCFGPAWVFSESVIARFGSGMLNFNGIPIPHYLGGAHYTWQILNGNRDGGCYLQRITTKLDRGDILRGERFKLPPQVVTPQDYFAANHTIGCGFLERLFVDFKQDRQFNPIPFDRINNERLYFPRLLTKFNAYIDWSWTGRQIALFCQSFDAPYMGAGTMYRSEEVRLKNVVFEANSEFDFHPYVSGLVVRKLSNILWVGVQGGMLRIEFVGNGAGENILRFIREGERFSTDPHVLYKALSYSAKVAAK